MFMMPYGIFNFEVHDVTVGQTVTMDILIPRDEAITGYYKKNKRTGIWEDIATSVDHVSLNGRTKITIQLIEGGVYDSDSIDTMITDPGGPAFRSSHSIPTLSQWGMIIFSLILGFMAILFIRKQSHEGSVA